MIRRGALVHAPGGETQVPTLSVWESRRIWGNCPTPKSIEVERSRVSDKYLVVPRSLVAFGCRVSRTMSPESLVRAIGLSRTLE